MTNKTLTLITLIFVFLLIGIINVSATYSQSTPMNITVSCSKINCSVGNNITVISPNSLVIISNQPVSSSVGYVYYPLNSSQTSLNGDYQLFMRDTNGLSYSESFKVTPNGETPTTANAIFYIGLLAVLLIFLCFTIYSFMSFDNLLNRVGMLGATYLLLIAISFISWSMASDFLTSSPFLIGMLWIIFLVLMIGFPLIIIGGFAWYFLMLMKIKEITDLMEKGISVGEATDRVNRRRR